MPALWMGFRPRQAFLLNRRKRDLKEGNMMMKTTMHGLKYEIRWIEAYLGVGKLMWKERVPI